MLRVLIAMIVAGSAPVISAQAPEVPLRVRIDEVARRAARDPGLLVAVEGTVLAPLGPQLFAIRDARFLDPDGDVLVAMAAPLVAAVAEGAGVRVIGRLHPAVSHDDALEIPVKPLFSGVMPRLPIIVAESVAGPDGAQLAMAFENGGKPVSLARAAGARASDLVGRRLDGCIAHVLQTRPDGTLWVGAPSAPTPRLLVVPSTLAPVKAGDRVELRGVLLQLPAAFANMLRDGDVTTDERIYLYAADVQAATVRPDVLRQ